MVEVGRDLKGRETRVRRWMRDRFLQNNFIFIYLSIVVILFLFLFLSVNCLLLIFCCLICVDFFFFAILCFFCLFFCYTLPCFCWFWGDWAYRVICFVIYCYLFILFYFFFNLIYFYFLFYLHGFSGFIFRKFNCSWHFFTSSDRVPLGGVECTEAPFRGLVSRVVSYTSDDLGGASGLVDMELMKWYRGNG